MISALGNFDYKPLLATRTFQYDSENQSIICAPATILEDETFEKSENFTITITSVDSNVILKSDVMTITIIDNDGLL